MRDEFSIQYEEFYNKRIDSINGKFDSKNKVYLDKIKDDITDAYAKGKITEQYYSLLNHKISDYENNHD